MSKRTFDEMSGQATGLPPMTASILKSGMWSDLTIECKGQAWKVHRLVIGLQSKPFAAAINSGFKEAKTGIIKLDDHDPEVVGHMLSFLYSGDYTISQPKFEPTVEENSIETAANLAATSDAEDEGEDDDDDTPPAVPFGVAKPNIDTSKELLVHTGVYLIAEEKDIPALKQLAKSKYEKALPNGWNSVAFCTSLRRIFEETPENDPLLWDVAVSFAGKKAKELLDRGEFVELWKEKGEICVEVLRAALSPQVAPAVTSASSTYTNPFGSSICGIVKGQCPKFPTSHANSITTGRNKRWYCKKCGVPFD